MMSGIRGKDTRPELLVRKALHARGFRYRLHKTGLPGRPDIVLPRFRAVALIHGCFWHGHDCPLFRLPGTRTDFWRGKITRNQERDSQVAVALRVAGWRRATIWECALRGRHRLDFDVLIETLCNWLREDGIDDLELRGTDMESAPIAPAHLHASPSGTVSP